ncbi:hypothetical protein HOP50_01g08140 [Chloropicon primus]|uniref:C3H1-type domain-containing protein n=1 Tax=Chloropicon primus TaxID=1764295 RepID=A0A5B8MCY7_9CHLO|nr:hypothetical protein A3770_01p08270 [Chloropicon primus]UPQ97519.1 hypothetical protein HOP50_01g08140 [Chloropicon primus]|eukprot:QDZ18309.1 hypothetical protein A3770_01p08270 [Chloropicon primus]
MEEGSEANGQSHYSDAAQGKSVKKGGVAKQKPGGPAQDDTIVQYLYKTKMCYHWQSGYCLMGSNCNFAHGRHELRIPRSFAITSENGQDVPVPENAFNNRDLGKPVPEYQPQAPSGPEAYNRALKGFKDGSNNGEYGYRGAAGKKSTAGVGGLLQVQVEGNFADMSVHEESEKANKEPQQAVETKAYFQVEGNPNKPFGGDFNGAALGGARGIAKPLRVKITKSSPNNMEEQTEKVQTPKWAGWLLDTPTPHAENSPRATGSNGARPHKVSENQCPMCGHVEAETKDAEVQCELLTAPQS